MAGDWAITQPGVYDGKGQTFEGEIDIHSFSGDITFRNWIIIIGDPGESGATGIDVWDVNGTVTIENCAVLGRNRPYNEWGIYVCDTSKVIVKNCYIRCASVGIQMDCSYLGWGEAYYYNNLIYLTTYNSGGISICNAYGAVFNNTIIGVTARYDQPFFLEAYDYANCEFDNNILYFAGGIGGTGIDASGYSYIVAHNNCMYNLLDPTDIWQSTLSESGRIEANPCFVSSDGYEGYSLKNYYPNGYFLASDSPCVDAGYNEAGFSPWGCLGTTSVNFTPDNVSQANKIDIGFHYPIPPGYMNLTVTPLLFGPLRDLWIGGKS